MDLYWLDLETSGLDPRRDGIMEIAVCKATLASPYKLTEVYDKVVYYGGSIRDPIIEAMHHKSGLSAACYSALLDRASIERELLALIPEQDEKPVLAGSSVHFDAAFLSQWMPTLRSRFSHRMFDVSAVKLFCQSMGMPQLPKAQAHRAMADIKESAEHGLICAEWLRGQRQVKAVG